MPTPHFLPSLLPHLTSSSLQLDHRLEDLVNAKFRQYMWKKGHSVGWAECTGWPLRLVAFLCTGWWLG